MFLPRGVLNPDPSGPGTFAFLAPKPDPNFSWIRILYFFTKSIDNSLFLVTKKITESVILPKAKKICHILNYNLFTFTFHSFLNDKILDLEHCFQLIAVLLY